MDANDPSGFVGNFDSLAFAKAGPGPRTPFTTAAFMPNQTIQAEDFDAGGEGVAYHDADAQNVGSADYRPGSGVDVEPTGKVDEGYDLGFTRPGEYLVYSLNVLAGYSGDFVLNVRLASLRDGGAFHAELDGQRVADFAVPDTTGWQQYTTLVSQQPVPLAVGRHTLRLVMDRANPTGYVANFDWLRFTAWFG
jgi:hypothetical protein